MRAVNTQPINTTGDQCHATPDSLSVLQWQLRRGHALLRACTGGTLEVLLRNADSPMAAQTPKEHADRIMYARLALPPGGPPYPPDCPPQLKSPRPHPVALP